MTSMFGGGAQFMPLPIAFQIANHDQARRDDTGNMLAPRCLVACNPTVDALLNFTEMKDKISTYSCIFSINGCIDLVRYAM